MTDAQSWIIFWVILVVVVSFFIGLALHDGDKDIWGE